MRVFSALATSDAYLAFGLDMLRPTRTDGHEEGQNSVPERERRCLMTFLPPPAYAASLRLSH